MNQPFENPNDNKPEEPTCSLCRSPLIQEAIDAGKCQCCGHRIEAKKQEVQDQ